MKKSKDANVKNMIESLVEDHFMSQAKFNTYSIIPKMSDEITCEEEKETIEEVRDFLASMVDDKAKINDIKKILVNHQKYDLAARIRDLEKKYYPEKNPEGTKEYKQAEEVCLALRLVDLDCDLKSCYKLLETMKLYIKKTGKFDMKDAVKIKERTNKIFGEK